MIVFLLQIHPMDIFRKIQQFLSTSFIKTKKSTKDGVIIIKSSESLLLEIKLEDLICIKSKGNKSIIYYEDKSVIKSELIRKSLKRFQIDLENQDPKIIRCHKSYIVNLNKVNMISGTTKGFKLHHKELDFKIPVSRRLGIDDLNQPDLFSL